MEKAEMLVTLTTDQLKGLIESTVRAVIQEEKGQAEKEPESPELMTRKEVAEMFGRSLVTVNEWMKKGLLPFYRMNRKIYFKKHEVMAAMQGGRKAPTRKPQ